MKCQSGLCTVKKLKQIKGTGEPVRDDHKQETIRDSIVADEGELSSRRTRSGVKYEEECRLALCLCVVKKEAVLTGSACPQ